MPKMIHTSDWHLGKKLNGKFDLIEDQRAALEDLLRIVTDEDPDVVVVAGDVFDTPDRPPLSALRLWAWASEALIEGRPDGRPLVVIPGNHDHAERLSLNANLAKPNGLHLVFNFEDALQPTVIAGIEFSCFPFHKPARVRAIAEDIHDPATVPTIGDYDYDAAMRWLAQEALRNGEHDGPRVAVAHAYVDGADAEGSGEDPVMLGGAGGVTTSAFDGYDYVALGHIHRAYPLPGSSHVRYAGSLYPCAFDERSDKSVTIVEWAEGPGANREPNVRTVPLATTRRVRVIDDLSFDDVLAKGRRERADGDASVEDYILASVTDRYPVPHAQTLLTEVYPNAQFEQRWLEVAIEGRHDVPDPKEHTMEEMFEAFYRFVEGDDAAMTPLEKELLLEALDGLGEEREA